MVAAICKKLAKMFAGTVILRLLKIVAMTAIYYVYKFAALTSRSDGR